MLSLMALAHAAPVVASMTELPPYRRLTADDLTLVEVPDALVHPNAITAIEQAAGRIALEPLLPGEPLRKERLGVDARTVLLGPREDLVLLPLARPEQWAPGRIDLVALTADGGCLLAQDVRSHGSAEAGLLSLAVDAVDAHRLRWSISQQPVVPLARNPIDRSREPQLACGGGLPVSHVEVPSGAGTLLRLQEPMKQVTISHLDRAVASAITPTDVWLHGVAQGDTAAAIHLAYGPPIVAAIHVTAPQSARSVPLGALAAVAVPGIEDAKVWPPDTAVLTRIEGHLLVSPRAPGRFEVWTRAGANQDLHTFDATDLWVAPTRDDVVLPLTPGKRRKVALPGTIVGAWAGDPRTASVEIKGTRARIQGVQPGTTEVVVMDDTGAVSTVRVVVLP